MATVLRAGQRSMQQLLQQIVDRLVRVERRSFLATANWRISEDAAGRLIATHVPTGVVTVLAAPPTTG